MTIHNVLEDVTQKIIERSKQARAEYIKTITDAGHDGPNRNILSAGNKAHAFAACPIADKKALIAANWPNIGIVTAYNDMLSAHQPYQGYPDIIKAAARKHGATAQVAGGVPAMCDGVTQGQLGMEMSLFSRDAIAMGTAIALSHNSFDAALYLGICDKIVPGLLIGALQFGHIPAIFVPAGPMTSGLPNNDKARIRQLYAEGKASREELLEAEMKSYHSAGTCTFYGTANSNQILMEMMGLHLPASSFINPNTPLRDALTEGATKRAIEISAVNDDYRPICDVISEKSIVNAIIGLLATGGSTNHTIHIPSMARAAGVIVTWDDFDALSRITPLLTKIYPNGQADVNHFHAAGGVGYLVGTLLNEELVHNDVRTVVGDNLSDYAVEPILSGGALTWQPAPNISGDKNVIADPKAPFDNEGGLRILAGNIGRSVAKVSAVKPEHRIIKAAALVFDSQEAVIEAYEDGQLNQDTVVVLRFQGPAANGMPELHKLTPALGALLDQGHQIALVTDGRMSGASGKVPAAIHVTPEACKGGAISKIVDGDIITLNTQTGLLSVAVDNETLAMRPTAKLAPEAKRIGFGRDLFSTMRRLSNSAEQGGGYFSYGDATDYQETTI